MKYTRIGLAIAILFAVQSAVFAGPYERLWSEDYDGYVLGDLPSQDASWTSHGPVSAFNVQNTFPFAPVDYGLGIGVVDSVSEYYLGYGLKDLSGELASTDSRRIVFEFDAWIFSRASQLRAQETGYRLQDPCENDIVYLLTRNTSEAGVYQLNGVDISHERWIYGKNHYKLDIDFAADTVDIYIDYEETSSATASLPSDFEPDDIQFLRLDAAIYFAAGRNIANYTDNVELYDNREWNCPAGDVFYDCEVDLNDFSMIANNWLLFDIDPNSP